MSEAIRKDILENGAEALKRRRDEKNQRLFEFYGPEKMEEYRRKAEKVERNKKKKNTCLCS